ncbi:MAG: cyclodeaminase/cyclohydrolase family protein [Microbacteriaceae bacterium]|nr:cyclodeaminase/cyclohydrolase family protein [Microbacteriaceae bacterium]
MTSSVEDYLDRPLRALFDNVAGADPVPAAGSVIAAMGALAAGLTAKVAHRSASRLLDSEEIAGRADELRRRLEPLITADAVDYAAALAKRGGDRADALQSLSSELVIIVETASEIAQLASALVTDGNPNLRYDADAAVRIAVTVAEIGGELIGANVGDSELSHRAHAAVAVARTAARGETA